MENTNTNLSYEYFFPMLVSSWEDSEDSKEEILARWAMIKTIPEESQAILLSEATAKTIRDIVLHFNLTLEDGQEIARIVRDLFFSKITPANLQIEVTKRFDFLDIAKVQLLSKLIKEKIISSPINSQTQANMATDTIESALKKYPEIGEQTITSNKISLKNFPEPVRPSLKNWIADYTFTVGYGEHDSIQRGNYLFQNANAKVLNYEDRQKLIYTLKSFDDNLQVTINKDLKQIVFPKFAAAPAPTPTQPQQPKPAAAPTEIKYARHPVRPVAAQPQQTQHNRVLESLPKRNLDTIANFNSQAPSPRPVMPNGPKPVPSQNVVSLKPSTASRPNLAPAEPRRNVSFAPPAAVQHDKAPASLPVALAPKPTVAPQPRPITTKPIEGKFEIKASHNNINDANKTNINAVKFSSPQKLPYEKAKLQPYRISPVYGNTDEDQSSSISKPVVDLKN